MLENNPHPGPGAHDWTHHGRHRLRAPDGVIVDLPVHVDATSQVWVATIWPEPRVPGGWDRAVWEAAGRGWRLPHQLAAGDVVEFGADTPSQPVRWFGIMDSYEPDRWATLQGPYPSPLDAWTDAQRLLARERFLPPIPIEPPQPEHHNHGRRGRHPRRSR